MWFQTTLRLTLLQQHSIPPSSTTLAGKVQEEMQSNISSSWQNKLLTFLPESLLPPVFPYPSFLYKKIFDTVLSLGLLSRTLSQNLDASVTFLPHEFCFIFFHFFSLSQHPPPVSPKHWCWDDSLSNYSHHISLCELHWQLLLFLYTKFKFLPLHAKLLGKNPRIIPLPRSYNYKKHLSNPVL